MHNVEMEEKEQHQDGCTENAPKEARRYEKDRLTPLDHKAEKNLMAKRAMASELASMGLSNGAIDRLLHLKGRIESEKG